MEGSKTWFCQECKTMMEPQPEGFDKCPACGAEAWLTGEADFKQDAQRAAVAQKLHGVWYCQRCRVPMLPVDDAYCKCPQCAAEVWYGKPRRITREEIRAVMESTEDFPAFPHTPDIYAAMTGGRPIKSGGTHTGKKRKADLRKPTTQQLYKRLCSS